MPELPEVEVVRRGLERHLVGWTIEAADIRGARVARRHPAGPHDLAARLVGRQVAAARRRGKYLWLELADPDPEADVDRDPAGGLAASIDPANAPQHDLASASTDTALLLHLGMSGQLLVLDPAAAAVRHTHAVLSLSAPGAGERQLRFVDQRTFGGMLVTALRGPQRIPEPITHIAADPLEPAFDQSAVIRRMKARDSAVKRALLDQTLVSGVGNIYADEALWRAGVHGERRCSVLTRPALGRILDTAAEVMTQALEQGGTSFDALYVNVNGTSGYFSRELQAYGQAGRPCQRCGTLIVREHFMNRSSFSCPRCQPRPRRLPVGT